MTRSDDERPRAEWLIPLVVASGLLIELMDSAALALALPTMAREFGLAPVQLKLALTAYLMTMAMLVPASGWLSNRYGARRIFMTAIVVFIAGSICSGLSTTLGGLVASRVLQGIGGSMMTPVGRSIVVATSPRARLVKAMGWFTMPAIFGPMLGPPLAGLLIEHASWRWIFFINVPIGLAGVITVAMFVPRIDANCDVRFDGRGFAMMASAIAALMLAAETRGLVPDAARVALAVFGGTSFTAYVLYALRTPDPILDLRLLRQSTLTVSAIAGSLTRLSVGALPFLLPLLLQVGMGISPLTTSYVTIVMALGTLSARFTVPPLIRALGFRRAMLVLGAATAVMALAPAWFRIGTPLELIAVVMCLGSAMRAAFLVSSTSLAYADMRPIEVGHATVLLAVTQQISLGAGVSLSGWLLENARRSGEVLSPEHFAIPFAVMAGLGALSLLAVARLRPDAAAALRGNS